jgi:hypothetical protein
LKKKIYHAGLKNDGERFLFCFFEYEKKFITCLVNRKGDTFLINISATKQAFMGTVVDCELVGNTLFIFDCYVVCGRNLQGLAFSERLSAADTIINSIKCINHSFDVVKKQFVPIANFEILTKLSLENTDGYIFMPENDEVRTGTHNTMFKWKPLLKNTIDFALMGNKTYLQNGGKLTWVKVKIDTSALNIQISNDTPTIVECEFVCDKSWKALNVRNDKTYPNSQFTYKKTLINIIENIIENEFIF